MDNDVTSRLPNDITVKMVTLAMGHGQTVISGLRNDVTEQCITSGLLTDSTIMMVNLTAAEKKTKKELLGVG